MSDYDMGWALVWAAGGAQAVSSTIVGLLDGRRVFILLSL